MYVADPASLADLLERLRSAERIAFDIEFMRERTYYARLCLIQVAADGVTAAVDAIAIEDLTELFGVLNDPSVLKVVHAGSQDLEIAFQISGAVPAPVFDTQIAATLAGFPAQVAYGALVRDLLGVTLPKAHRFTDWCVRPLSADQVEYALDDVRHLPALHEVLRDRLEARGRSQWVQPEFERLADPASYAVDASEQYLRVKGHSALDRRGLGVLRELAAWREREAQRRDLPRKWLLSDESLVEIARRRPETETALGAVRGVSGKLSKGATPRVLESVRKGLAVPADELPRAAPRRDGSSERDAVVDLMNAVLRVRAREQGVALQALATRDDLERLAAGEREGNALLSGWRRALAGEELLALLEGDIALQVEQGRVVTRRRG